jgi:GT2 family glycosyltransferase
MRFSVCIPTVRPDTVAAAVRAVRNQTYANWDLVVVGQGDESALRAEVERAAAGDSRVRYVHLDRRGASAARNAGIAATNGDAIAFVDDDCEAAPDWLAKIDAGFQSDPAIGFVIGGLVCPPAERRLFAVCPSFTPPDVVYDPISAQRVPPPDWSFVTASFAIRRDVAARVGPLDESLGAGTTFPAAEDTDYMLRLELLGVKMLATPHVVVHHTYGYRYGVRAVYAHKRNYARGNGALAAKLTLLGDPRGQDWVERSRRAATLDRWRKPHQIPGGLFRQWHFKRGYQECLRGYETRTATGTDPRVSAVLARR